MKRIISIIISLLLLTGCNKQDQNMQHALALRESLSSSNSISFTTVITANYADKTYSFTVSSKGNNTGDLNFQVLAPDTISGITGKISANGGKLTFDETALAFPLLAEGELSPVSAPWILLKTLLGGYISSCGRDGDNLRITMDDSYEEDALQLDIWLNDSNVPIYAEILWQGRHVLSMHIENFEIL